MSALVTTPNIRNPDAFYERLIAVHDGLTEEESAALNARLILILANQIGDETVIGAALDLARGTGRPAAGNPPARG